MYKLYYVLPVKPNNRYKFDELGNKLVYLFVDKSMEFSERYETLDGLSYIIPSVYLLPIGDNTIKIGSKKAYAFNYTEYVGALANITAKDMQGAGFLSGTCKVRLFQPPVDDSLFFGNGYIYVQSEDCIPIEVNELMLLNKEL